VLLERISLGVSVDEATTRRRGWYAIEGDGGDDPFATLGAAVRALRAVEARARLAPA
jgi:hypothetical protein